MNIQEWLAAYGVSHTNPTNKKVHFVCVPVIFFSIVGLFYSVSFGDFMGIHVTLAHLALLLVAVYYFKLSNTLAVGMCMFSILCLFACEAIQQSAALSLWKTSLGLFVIAWIFQFWGHKIEGKKPSFLEDIQFLMIGPAWIMSFIYQKIGINL